MSDLTSGRYAQQSPAWAQLGMQNNLAQPSVPAFTNAPASGAVEDGAPFITKEETTVPIFVPWGVSIEKISVFNGATATKGAVTHAWAAVRSGLTPASGGEFAPVLLAQSKDNTAYEAKKTETLAFTLEKSVLVTPENAPNGYVYISVFLDVAEAVGTYAAFEATAAALNKASSGLKVFPWFTGCPINTKSKPVTAATAEKTPKEAVLVEVAPVLVVQ
jgi:hypothetical protein